ncbi:hypothetical protein OG863_37775 [Streptomyces decoyicus]|uniref:Uncharacterized protein n=1 Tax=Streptomyces decoyicus TaxID=249567 RepID=A0ABZ1FVZ6_9ACTN|nr:hypothetical protein [Streptomyces decoyicus]WSB74321.1 hypothetical protein OG863_37775 [Streptomyces decoyicus]
MTGTSHLSPYHETHAHVAQPVAAQMGHLLGRRAAAGEAEVGDGLLDAYPGNHGDPRGNGIPGTGHHESPGTGGGTVKLLAR